MKILGGTFGTSGSAYLSRDGYLVVNGAKNGLFGSEQVVSLDTESSVEKKTSVLSWLLGIVVVIAPLTLFFGIFGLIFGVLITWLGSRYSNKRHQVKIEFEGGDKVSLDCTSRQVDKLVRFKG